MSSRQAEDSQAVAAAKAGVSERSGRRIESGKRSARAPRDWRTRKDPFADVWESELVPLLNKEPGLSGLTLWEHLDELYPGKYPSSLLRTLQQRVKHYDPPQHRRTPQQAIMIATEVDHDSTKEGQEAIPATLP